jgi:hypothetical protein
MTRKFYLMGSTHVGTRTLLADLKKTNRVGN